MARPPKTLLEHVHDRSFIPSRHANLLATDDGIERMTFTDDELATSKGEYWRRLYDVQLWYRHKAANASDRRNAALAFCDAVDFNFDRYRALFFRDGRRLVWSGKPTALIPCECANCKRPKHTKGFPILSIPPLVPWWA
jgi:hypothetical protein